MGAWVTESSTPLVEWAKCASIAFHFPFPRSDENLSHPTARLPEGREDSAVLDRAVLRPRKLLSINPIIIPITLVYKFTSTLWNCTIRLIGEVPSRVPPATLL